jgi:hypothetical protein
MGSLVGVRGAERHVLMVDGDPRYYKHTNRELKRKLKELLQGQARAASALEGAKRTETEMQRLSKEHAQLKIQHEAMHNFLATHRASDGAQIVPPASARHDSVHPPLRPAKAKDERSTHPQVYLTNAAPGALSSGSASVVELPSPEHGNPFHNNPWEVSRILGPSPSASTDDFANHLTLSTAHNTLHQSSNHVRGFPAPQDYLLGGHGSHLSATAGHKGAPRGPTVPVHTVHLESTSVGPSNVNPHSNH